MRTILFLNTLQDTAIANHRPGLGTINTKTRRRSGALLTAGVRINDRGYFGGFSTIFSAAPANIKLSIISGQLSVDSPLSLCSSCCEFGSVLIDHGGTADTFFCSITLFREIVRQKNKNPTTRTQKDV
jgi:hypothetical protein